MEIVYTLIAFSALIALDVTAWFWGTDSRVGIDDGREFNSPARRSI